MTVVLDSSGWIELLSGSPRAKLYQPVLRAGKLLVPAIVRYEVARYTLTQGGEPSMELALRALSRFEFISMDAALADSAARLAHRHKFSLADAFVYATAQAWQAELWTQDRHFSTLPNVKYFRK